MKTSIETLQRRAAIDNQILAVLAQGPKGKIWSEREIADALGYFPVSICALERLQEAGKVKLTLRPHTTYRCQLV